VLEHPRGRTKEAPLARTETTPITVTAACELGTHYCRGVVLSLTDAHLSRCECPCHANEPDDSLTAAEGDGEAALEAAAEVALEWVLEDAHFGEGDQ
jgi:hypothetical protein